MSGLVEHMRDRLESAIKEASRLRAEVERLNNLSDGLNADLLRRYEEASRLRAELIAYQNDVEGAERRTLAFAHACVRDVEGITVGGALEAQRDEIAKLRAERDALADVLRKLLDQDEHSDDEVWVRIKARAALAKLEGKQ